MQIFNSDRKLYLDAVLKIIIFLTLYLIVALSMVLLCNKAPGEPTFTASQYKDSPIIIIDAGHGGVDGGAVSESGIVEKEINLKIAKYLKNYLSLSGVECIMTRSDDIELTPKNSFSTSRKRRDLLARIEIANSYDNALFISIHQNTYPSSRLSGLQVFYSKNNAQSKVLADIIRNNNMMLIDSKNKRETKPAGREILVLDSVDIPAVLIECGFLSNAKEASMLADDEYQKKLSFMIFTSVNEYIKNNFS